MPLIHELTLENNTRLAVWQVTEPEDFFLEQKGNHTLEWYEPLESLHPVRRIELLASRHALDHLVGEDTIKLTKDPNGKPIDAHGRYHVSLSHTVNYVAAMLSTEKEVGVDIEQVKERVKRIAKKFIRPDEFDWLGGEPATEDLVLCWSAKETLYKLYAKKELDFREHLRLFNKTGNTLQGTIHKGDYMQTFTVQHQHVQGNVLTWVVGD